ncbi:hypothetical protein Trydic_g8451 [Trypoxylus dichotomus]
MRRTASSIPENIRTEPGRSHTPCNVEPDAIKTQREVAVTRAVSLVPSPAVLFGANQRRNGHASAVLNASTVGAILRQPRQGLPFRRAVLDTVCHGAARCAAMSGPSRFGPNSGMAADRLGRRIPLELSRPYVRSTPH